MEWHKTMYNKDFAQLTLNSEEMLNIAKEQVDFILDVINAKRSLHILDIPCGTGRHAHEFSKQGHYVTGVDINQDCLSLAQSKSSSVQFLEGNMKDLKAFHASFDLVCNLFTSFGYFESEQENLNVLRELKSCLTPSGFLVIEIIDRDYIETHFSPTLFEENDFYTCTVNNHWRKDRIFSVHTLKNKKNNQLSHQEYSLRVYTQKELFKLFEKAKLNLIHCFADHRRTEFSKGKSARPFYFLQPKLSTDKNSNT